MRYLLTLVFGFCLLGAQCVRPNAPREQARAVVLTLAEGVRIGDQACATYALATRDLKLAESCAFYVDQARAHLIAAESGVDAWTAASQANIPCTVKHAAEVLAHMAGEMHAHGADVPPALVDALAIAPMLAGACTEGAS